MKTAILRILSCVLAACMLFAAACEPVYDLDLVLEKGKMPPEFRFSGLSHAYEFEILELPKTDPLNKTNPFKITGRTIWKINSPKALKGDDWPAISYGETPSGFAQAIPIEGTPPALAEEKLFAARITVNKDSRTTLFFEIRHGKPVDVSSEVFELDP